MAAGSIVVDLLMKTGSFETDTKRAEKRLKELEKTAVDAGKLIAGAFAAVSAATAVMVKSQIDAADEMGKAASKAGITTESLSALAYAAELSGSSQDEMTASLAKLSRQMQEAATGSASAQSAFASIGVSVTDASGQLKTADQVFAEIAQRFAEMPDGVQKTSAAIEIFGKSGANLIPTLNSGATGLKEMADEAQRLGIVMSKETAEAAAQFNDNITRLQTTFSGIVMQITKSVLPGLNDLTTYFLNVARDVGVANAALITFGRYIARAVGADDIARLTKEARSASLEVASLDRQLTTVLNAPAFLGGGPDSAAYKSIRARLDAAIKRAAAINEQLKAFLAEEPGGKPPAMPATPSARTPPKLPATKAGKTPAPPAGRNSRQLQESSEDSERYSFTAVAKLKLEFPEMGEVAEASAKLKKQLQEVLPLGETVLGSGNLKNKLEEAVPLGEMLASNASLKKKLDEFQDSDPLGGFISEQLAKEQVENADAYEKALEVIARAQLSAKDSSLDLTQTQRYLMDLMASPEFKEWPETWKEAVVQQGEYAIAAEKSAAQLEKLNRNQARLKDLLGLTELEKHRDDLMLLVDAYQNGAISIEDYTAAVNRYMDSINSRADEVKETTDKTQGLVKELGMTFSSAFEDAIVSGSKLSDVLRGIAQDLLRIATRKLVTEPIANAFTSALSNSVGSFFGGGKAGGGDVIGGRSYLVGENGPEMFTPRTTGTITPSSGVGGPTIIQNINVTTGVQQTVRAEIMSLMPQIAGAAKSAVADAKLRGGSYASALR